ncbi:MAG TPA: hypothetical protein VKE93_07580 [Candidatus Angelobacter sp.]|nr:hypothetical protein [Candidatus Angelobacter sp.]
MVHLRKLLFVAAVVAVTSCAAVSAATREPPANLCSLLSAADVSKTLGQTYDAPQESVAPRPFPNTNTGTDCNYLSKSGNKLWFRAYVDSSPSEAADLFAKLSKFYGTPKPVKGLGDEAYFDQEDALHVRKGKVRFYINLSTMQTFNPAKQKQIRALANLVAGRL